MGVESHMTPEECTDWQHGIFPGCAEMTGAIGTHPMTPEYGWLGAITILLIVLAIIPPIRNPARKAYPDDRYNSTRHLRRRQSVHR